MWVRAECCVDPLRPPLFSTPIRKRFDYCVGCNLETPELAASSALPLNTSIIEDMTASKTSVLRVFVVFVGGVLLNFLLLAFAGQILMRQLEMRRHLLEAQNSAAAYKDLAEAFRSKGMWMNFVVMPTIGCLIGTYAAFCQRAKPALLAVACLLPVFAYEITSQPLREWPLQTDLQYFGVHALEFSLAVVATALLREFLNKRHSPMA